MRNFDHLGGVAMAVPKLIIRPKKYTEESAVISMRLPKDMLRDIDAIAKYVGCTRNEILVQCLEFALAHLEVSERQEGTDPPLT